MIKLLDYDYEFTGYSLDNLNYIALIDLDSKNIIL